MLNKQFFHSKTILTNRILASDIFAHSCLENDAGTQGKAGKGKGRDQKKLLGNTKPFVCCMLAREELADKSGRDPY